MIKAERLKKGDMIAFLTPSSPVYDTSKIERAISYFEKEGYSVLLPANFNADVGYLAGTDEQRRDDIHEVFSNPDIKAVICARGGYGASRLLNMIDYELIKKNPKIFCGYSDVTTLQNAIYSKTGLITFAGPMAAIDFEGEVEPFTENNFWNTLTSDVPVKFDLPEDEKLSSIRSGNCRGNLIGGNLSLFVTLIGTPFIPDPESKILFLEEVSEPPYKIDRMFSHLLNAGYLEKLSGIIFGGFTDCIEQDPAKQSQSLSEVVDYYFNKVLNKPVVWNIQHGHLKKNLTLPIGIPLLIDADNCKVEYLESAVN